MTDNLGLNNRVYQILSQNSQKAQAVLIRSGKVILGKNYVETRRKQKMKNDNIYGPGNITKALGINVEQDGENLLDGSIALSPRIHPVDRAIAKQRKNSKPRDKHLWRFTLVL